LYRGHFEKPDILASFIENQRGFPAFSLCPSGETSVNPSSLFHGGAEERQNADFPSKKVGKKCVD
jgi:hypothetical protein